MFKVLLLCLSLAWLITGLFVEDRCGEYGTTVDTPSIPLSIWNLYDGQYKVKAMVDALRYKIYILTPKILKNDVTKDWQEIMSGMVQILDDGLTMYQDMLYGTIQAGGRMFEGDYDFQKQRRCRALKKKLNQDPDFGNHEFFKKFGQALGKDLPCLSNILTETYALQLNGGGQECITSDDDAIKLVTNVVRILFRLRNDGQRFFHYVAEATYLNGTDFHDHFINATDSDMTRRFIQDFDQA